MQQEDSGIEMQQWDSVNWEVRRWDNRVGWQSDQKEVGQQNDETMGQWSSEVVGPWEKATFGLGAVDESATGRIGQCQ
jgi:hypothetical protein